MDTFDSTRPAFEPYGFTCVRWQPSVMPRPDHHNEIELNYLHDGWVTYLFSGRKVRLEAGEVAAFWATFPHQIIDFSKSAHFYVGTIPFSWFLQFRLPGAFTESLLQGAFFTEAMNVLYSASRSQVTGRDMWDRWLVDMESPVKESKQAVRLEMQSLLLRLGLVIAEKMQSTDGNDRGLIKRTTLSTGQEGALSKMEQVAIFIAKNYQDKLSAEVVSHAVGLHPNYVMTVFKETFGMTLAEFWTKLRISHAERLLVTTDEKVVNIAFDSGFGSISRFSEAFRRHCNCTPREYRKHFRYVST